MSWKKTYEIAKVSEGVELAFIDSWRHRPIEDRPSTWPTIVAIHGVGFNSTVWSQLVEHLPADVRFVGYNQRAYTKSSPALHAAYPPPNATALYTVDLVHFLIFCVNTLDCRGGLTLLGWSKGSELALALLATLNEGPQPDSDSILSVLPIELTSANIAPFLNDNLRSVILYDTPGRALGQGLTPDAIAALGPVFPPNVATPQQVADAFGGWISGYAGQRTEGLPASELGDLQAVVGKAAWEPSAVAGAFTWFMGSDAETARLTRAAIFNPDSKFKIGFIYGTNTVEFCSSGERTLARWAEESGLPAPPLVEVEGANHFGMVLKPKDFAGAIAELLDKLK